MRRPALSPSTSVSDFRSRTPSCLSSCAPFSNSRSPSPYAHPSSTPTSDAFSCDFRSPSPVSPERSPDFDLVRSMLYILLPLVLHSRTPFANMQWYSLFLLQPSLRLGTRIVELLHASPRTCHRFRPSLSSVSHQNRRRLLCVEVAEYCPHLVAQSLERLLAWRRIHWVVCEVVEEDAMHHDEADQAPLHNLGPLVPCRLDRLEPCAPLELALEVELLLLGELAEVRRPSLLCGKSVAGEVEGRELALLPTQQAVDEAHRRHDGRLCMRQLRQQDFNCGVCACFD